MYVPNPDTAPNAVQLTDDMLTSVSATSGTAEKVSNAVTTFDETSYHTPPQDGDLLDMYGSTLETFTVHNAVHKTTFVDKPVTTFDESSYQTPPQVKTMSSSTCVHQRLQYLKVFLLFSPFKKNTRRMVKKYPIFPQGQNLARTCMYQIQIQLLMLFNQQMTR